MNFQFKDLKSTANKVYWQLYNGRSKEPLLAEYSEKLKNLVDNFPNERAKEKEKIQQVINLINEYPNI